MKILFTLLLTLAFIFSCSKPKPGSPEAKLILKNEAKKTQESVAEKTVNSIPNWCLKPTISNFSISACGMGESKNINISKNRAILDAKRQLADSIDSEISSRMEDFLKSTGMSSNEKVKQASEIVTKNTTIQAKLIGYKQIKTEVLSINGKYIFYVLIDYPVGEANKALLAQIKENEVLSTQKDADKAMAELEAEIEKRKKE